ncbi:hypothetical protein [Pirellula sp. SH-Sr6A]|uniref:hypothetical protein n=1 Tax=Pirellula sp. SH-Sr6A TaxID=1632865 RepID=UPI0011BAA376|nr:hypothetical protein [Pirellula sp. SH-Sr6A]
MKLERIALEQGEEAAYSYKLQLQGLDEATANLIAKEKAHVEQLKKIKAEQDKASQGPTGAKGTKATVEFLGSVSSLAGAGQVGSVAGQVGSLTEKISQFSEVSKLGGAGALAFKAGLVSAAAAIGFGIGKAIGDLVFETEKWNKALEDSIALQDKLNQKQRMFASDRFSRDMQDIAHIEDPAAQEEAQLKLIERLDDQALAIGKTIAKMDEQKKAISTFDEDGNIFSFATGKSAAELQREEIERNIASQKESLQLIRDQQIEVQKNIESQKEANRIADEKAAKLEEEKRILEDQRKQQEFERQQEEARKRAADEEFNQTMRLEEKTISLNRALEIRRIALEDGAEAARRQALEFEGLDAADAARIAAREQELQRMEQQKQQVVKEQVTASGPLQAVQSRTLLRGGGEGFQVKIADSTKKAADILAEMRKLQADLIEATKQNKPVPVNLEQR